MLYLFFMFLGQGFSGMRAVIMDGKKPRSVLMHFLECEAWFVVEQLSAGVR
jgi:hypothetical protein